jgi:hypothetical protein
MLGTDIATQRRIKSYVPTYQPAHEIAIMIEFADSDSSGENCLMARMNRFVVSLFHQPRSSAIPVVRRSELPSPKEAYERKLRRKPL